MSFPEDFKKIFDDEEGRTVSNSFGGTALSGRAPSFRVERVVGWLSEHVGAYPNDNTVQKINQLEGYFATNELKYVLGAAVRFAFLIELTNLNISSTKMKTRWLEGNIIKTRPDSFDNYRGLFAPGEDQRACSFEECLRIFGKTLDFLTSSAAHRSVSSQLSKRDKRSVSYEFILSYKNPRRDPVHSVDNVHLVDLKDIEWLVKARSILKETLTTKNLNKIKTKTYLTDRSQTGKDQTNRAKRWEVLDEDFQHATLEECWSVERKLLQDLVHFTNFPGDVKYKLIAAGVSSESKHITRCPVTWVELDYMDFVCESRHGESYFQVGHLNPLKAGGRHEGQNVAWITEDGNRIQGDLNLDEVRKMLIDIYQRMRLENIV
jgi:hypothetical protein